MKKKEQNVKEETPEVEKQDADLNLDENDTQKEEAVDAHTEEKPEEETPEMEKPELSEADEMVDKILQLNPQYEQLYINSKGFVFTEGTSKAMRGNAKLYKNKYFKK